MTYEALFEFFYWSSIFNVILLAWWSVWIMLGGSFVYKLHYKWFEMSRDDFNKIHYFGLAFYKLIILFFNIIPLLVLWKIGSF